MSNNKHWSSRVGFPSGGASISDFFFSSFSLLPLGLNTVGPKIQKTLQRRRRPAWEVNVGLEIQTESPTALHAGLRGWAALLGGGSLQESGRKAGAAKFGM